MVSASNIRLPGVYFLPPPHVAGAGLPPLDVAAFVGFAERGPLDTPVPIRDLETYRAVFGGEFVVAREAGGATINGALPGAVANFFANGGRRCYVVRVCGKQASATRFRMPGIVALNSGGASQSRLVSVSASSAGAWSQQIRIGTRLRTTPLPVSAFSVTSSRELSWSTGSAPEAIQTGDVLRLTFDDESQWLFPVSSVETSVDASPAEAVRLLANFTWEAVRPELLSPPPLVTQVQRVTATDVTSLDINGSLAVGPAEAAIAGERETEFVMFGTDAGAISAGDILNLALSDGSECLFAVSGTSTNSSSPAARVVTSNTRLLRLDSAALAPSSPASLRRVERLRFDLLLRQGKRRLPTLFELSFNAGPNRWAGDNPRLARLAELAGAQPTRFWGEVALFESSSLAHSSTADPDGNQAARGARFFQLLKTGDRIEEARDGDVDVIALAGVLAPVEASDTIYLPLGMQSILTEDDVVGPARDDVGSDDLDSFTSDIFVDPFLVPRVDQQSLSGDALIKEAFDRYYVQDKRLRGIHSLMFIDEVALIATPEAVHRGWQPQETQAPVLSPPITSPPISSPPLLSDQAEFHDCEPPAVPPVLVVEPPKPTEPTLPIVNDLQDYRLDTLLEIQHAMLTFCQARRDVLCILTLPLHFEKRQCIEWQETFRRRLGLSTRRSSFSSESREISDLSYAAVFHPWLLQRDVNAANGLRWVSCDGAACGMIAARERASHVWLAPANVPLQNVLGLTPAFDKDDWAELFDLQFNLVRAEPRDFRVMSAHTLSDEAILLQISVRRLMILLRKVAVERGMDFVFESNHQRFREAVRLMLEEALKFMFDRGAFAGATPEQSYRVVTDKSVNTPESVDAGRFIAQIQVAPSQPAEFITVLLTRVGEDLLQAAEG
ncbi:MAG TPA: hypothetical protein VHQ94_06020 [Pyrinomonadaceae bacterium]|jgi:hypothetical protein|nr:hypothetical protein [Pyrinomonadaceae bacterium]